MPNYALWDQIQRRAVDALYHGLQRGVHPALMGATGCGKTRIVSLLTDRLHEHGKVLIVAPSTEIVESFYDEASQITGLPIGRDQSGFKEPTNERIIVASLQSLGRSSEGRLAKYNPAEFAAIIWDEADGNAVANTLTANIARHFGVIDARGYRTGTGVPQVGVSATWQRHDGIALAGQKALFDELVDNITRDELEQAEILVRPETDTQVLDLEVPLTKRGEVDEEEWGRRINSPQLNDAAVKHYLANYADMQAIFFCPTVSHAAALNDRLLDAGVASCMVYGGTNERERDRDYHGLRSGQYQAVCVKECYTRGSNIPSLGVAFHLAATRSKARRIQRGGRVARAWDADSWDAKSERRGDPWCGDWWGLQRRKEKCVEVDYVGICRLPLALAPSLLSPEIDKPHKSRVTSRATRIEDVDDREFTGRAKRLQRTVKVEDDPVEFGWARRGDIWFMATPEGPLEVVPEGDGYLVGFRGQMTWWETDTTAFRHAHRMLDVVHPALAGQSVDLAIRTPDDFSAMWRQLMG